MTKEEAFNGWWNGGIAHPVDVGYDCAITAWNAACDWQKEQDIIAVSNEYLVEPTKEADDIAYDAAIFDAINAIKRNKC